MYNRRRSAVAAILALSLLLLPSLSFAANGPRHSAGSVGPLEIVVHWLARAWSVVSGTAPIGHAWQQAGCGIDPNGLPVPCDPTSPPGKPPGTYATVETGGIDPTQ